MNAVRKSTGVSPVKWVALGAAAISLSLFLGVTARAGKDHDKDKDHDQKQYDKDHDKDHDKGDKQDEAKKLRDEVISLLKDQIARDSAQVGLDQGQLTRDSLPPVAGGHPDRIGVDAAQLAKSLEKLGQDNKLLEQTQSDNDKSDKGKN